MFCIYIIYIQAFHLNISKINKYYTSVQFVSPGYKTSELQKELTKEDIVLLISIAEDTILRYYKETKNIYPKSFEKKEGKVDAV